MELSIREAKARLSEAISAMEAGERVMLTRHGRQVAELVKPVEPRGGFDFERARAISKELGLAGARIELPDDFDDPVANRRLLGLDD